ncbi:hypothetical protein H5410_065072, partial [Solanum commersonii]
MSEKNFGGCLMEACTSTAEESTEPLEPSRVCNIILRKERRPRRGCRTLSKRRLNLRPQKLTSLQIDHRL